MLEVISANEAYILSNNTSPLSKICNLLVENDFLNPVILVKKYLKIRSKGKLLVSISGEGKVVLNEKEVPLWRALVLPPSYTLTLYPTKELYLGIKGLSCSTQDKFLYRLRNGEVLSCTELNGNISLEKVVISKVPESLLREYLTLNGEKEREDKGRKIVEKIIRHVKLAKEAIVRGAKLVRVKVNGVTYEALIEEI
ncbi:MAG TPA: hypothetical protein ENF80_01800 [Thermofilum sp.]|nr:hypothetical protein [Thermofilum sp.]